MLELREAYAKNVSAVKPKKNAFSLFCGLRPPVDTHVINQHSVRKHYG